MNKKTTSNKPENTTLVLQKTLRDSLMQLKYKYNLDNLNQTIQLLYNIRNETKLLQLTK